MRALLGVGRVCPPLGLVIPRDCIAHIHEDLAQAALTMMGSNMRAEVVAGWDALDAAKDPVVGRR